MLNMDQAHVVTVAKNFSYFVAFVVSMEWLGLDARAVTIFAVLMVIDTITGVLRAGIVDGGRTVRSALLKRGILAKLLVLTALFSVALTAKGIGFDIGAVTQSAVSVLMLGELYSILGNVHSIRTGKHKVEFDAVAFLLGRVRTLIQKMVKSDV